jgi:hypothetical protein
VSPSCLSIEYLIICCPDLGLLFPFPELLQVPSGLLQVNFWAQPPPSTTGLLFLLLLSGGTAAAGGGSSIQPSAKTIYIPLILIFYNIQNVNKKSVFIK